MHDRLEAPGRRPWVTWAVVVALIFAALVVLGHSVTGARFYVATPQDPALAWVWRCTAALLVAAGVALGWTLSAAAARTAG